MLDMLLSKIKNGGGFLFQTQTFYDNDAFDVETYLKSPVEVMDVHSLPMHEIQRIIENHGLSIREVAGILDRTPWLAHLLRRRASGSGALKTRPSA